VSWPSIRIQSFTKIGETFFSHQTFFFWVEILSFSDLLATLDSNRGPRDLDLSVKMEALDPSSAQIEAAFQTAYLISSSYLISISTYSTSAKRVGTL